MSGSDEKEDSRIIRIREVAALTGLSRSAIYLAIREGTFPRQIKLSARSSGWIKGEVMQWVRGRPRA